MRGCRRAAAALAGLVAGACGANDGGEPAPRASRPGTPARAEPDPAPPLRVAVFNTSLYRDRPGKLAADLARGDDPQLRDVAAIVGEVDPEIIVLLEVDHDPAVVAPLRQALGGFPHWLAPPVNTGQPTGRDLDHDGRTDGPGDSRGYGAFPGQYGMLLLSRYPIVAHRCWGDLLWRDVPSAPLPKDWYRAEDLDVLPLSSKNHCDVTVQVRGQPLHILMSHPTPPVFDGPEDRNGLRNAGELQLWIDRLEGAPYLGPALPDDARFVLVGDFNADPHDGEGAGPVINALLSHPRLRDPRPTSKGAVWHASRQGPPNSAHVGAAALDTADFPDGPAAPGNLRTDYALPSANLTIRGSGVLWPPPSHALGTAVRCSDHRLVWVDIEL